MKPSLLFGPVPLRRLERVGKCRGATLQILSCGTAAGGTRARSDFAQVAGAPAGSVSVKTKKSLPPAPREVSGVRTPAAVSSALTDAVAAPLIFTAVAPGVHVYVNGGGGEPTTVRFHASEQAWMLTCSPLVGSVSSSDVGAAENLSVISLFAIVPPVEFRSASREIVSPAAMLLAPVAASLTGPTASLTVPDVIAWGPAVTLAVKVAKTPPMSAPRAPKISATDRAILR